MVKKAWTPRRGIEPRSPAWQAGILATILTRTEKVLKTLPTSCWILNFRSGLILSWLQFTTGQDFQLVKENAIPEFQEMPAPSLLDIFKTVSNFAEECLQQWHESYQSNNVDEWYFSLKLTGQGQSCKWLWGMLYWLVIVEWLNCTIEICL